MGDLTWAICRHCVLAIFSRLPNCSRICAGRGSSKATIARKRPRIGHLEKRRRARPSMHWQSSLSMALSGDIGGGLLCCRPGASAAPMSQERDFRSVPVLQELEWPGSLGDTMVEDFAGKEAARRFWRVHRQGPTHDRHGRSTAQLSIDLRPGRTMKAKFGSRHGRTCGEPGRSGATVLRRLC